MREDMNYNFSKLQSRVYDSLLKTDLNKIKNILSSIKDETLVSGVGGSNVVSNFCAKVLSKKNNIICDAVTPRDLLYKNISCYRNIISCSYSGNNFGVNVSFNNNLEKYLFSKKIKDGVENINYKVTDDEHSFISLSSTLIPMTILLLYYSNDMNLITSILSSNIKFELNSFNIYEVLSGYETTTVAKFIESTMTESGIGIPIIHDKYDYCHGRSTLGFNSSNNMIFFDSFNELDNIYRNELSKYYQNVLRIEKKFDDDIVNDYYFTYISMILCKEIALKQNKDLSIVNYSPLVKKLYYFKGEM